MSGYRRDPDRSGSSAPLKLPNKSPQATIEAFWKAYTHKYPGKVYQLLPVNPYAASKSASIPKGLVVGHPARESYEEARADCVAAVEKIAKECRRCNLRYRDPHFDIEWDLKTSGPQDHLDSLHPPRRTKDDPPIPRAVKRVHQIFEKPEFYIDGPTAIDIRQGIGGDCWFLAALGALGNKQGLIERICVKRDEAVGVYGFVFHRDGEWIHTTIDDKLYLKHADWDESVYEKNEWSRVGNRDDPEEEYRKAFQAGSRALYFAQCTLENETWLPLLEKAFAKAHGDYESINGGFTGEAIEDLTGGVTTELFTSDILDIEKFWTEELCQVNKQFLFGCATGRFDDWQGLNNGDRKGIEPMHAYSIMEAREVDGIRLLKIRNPWGNTEWSGPWSDGSSEWTAEWLERLNHKFGDDGLFWISYKDFLRKYNFLDRTRLFDSTWKITQRWTSVEVPWCADYNGTKFTFELTEPGPVVVVLSQLDDRYWQDFIGQYTFELHFRINKSGKDDYIVRSHGNYSMCRSVNTEVELEASIYDVRMKITAKRDTDGDTVENVVKNNVVSRPAKLQQVALSYDLAHAKGLDNETEEEKQHRAERAAKEEAEAKEKARTAAKEIKLRQWSIWKKKVERYRREYERQKAHEAKRAKKESEWEDEPEPEAEPEEPYQYARRKASRRNYENKSKGRPGDYAEDDYGEDDYDRRAPQERIDSFNQDPALRRQQTGMPEDGPSEGSRRPSIPATIYTYNSSVDSDLDRQWFPAKIIEDGDNPDESNRTESELDTDFEDFASDPWNAVCIVGLRVFTKNGQAKIKVVRPGDEVPREEVHVDSEGLVHGAEPVPLDIDDTSRGLSEDYVNPASGAADQRRMTPLPMRPGRQEDTKEKRSSHSGGKGKKHGKKHHTENQMPSSP